MDRKFILIALTFVGSNLTTFLVSKTLFEVPPKEAAIEVTKLLLLEDKFDLLQSHFDFSQLCRRCALRPTRIARDIWSLSYSGWQNML